VEERDKCNELTGGCAEEKSIATAWLEGRGSRDPLGPVVPLWEQFKAQHKRAVETSGVSFSAWAAFLQQSIPAISGMLHSFSFECIGNPPKTLPPIIRTSDKDAKRIAITLTMYKRHIIFVKGV
jgi:hypothetical protein